MAEESTFLRLPIELRLQIYDHCIVSGALTVSGCIVPPWWPRGIHSSSATIPGVAPDCLPLARLGFDRKLLEGRLDLRSCNCVSSASTGLQNGPCGPAKQSDSPPAPLQTPAWMLPARCSPSNQPPAFLAPTIPSLHLTCRQIHRELSTHQNPYSTHGSKTHRKLDLYLSYPDGVCIIVHRYPHLLHQARTVYVAGICDISGVKNPAQEPHDVVKNGRRRCEGPHVPPSMDEEQADALLALVRNVHLIGKRAIDAAERATDPVEDTNNNEATTSAPSPSSTHSPIARRISFGDSSTPPISSHPQPSTTLTIDPPPPTESNTPTPTFYLRIFYPAYHLRSQRTPLPNPIPHDKVWLHNLSPIALALASIHGGDIKFSLSRSSRGTGVEVIATGNKGRERVVHCLRPQHGFYGPSYEAQAWSWCIPHSWGVEGGGGGSEALDERTQNAGSAAAATAAAVGADAAVEIQA